MMALGRSHELLCPFKSGLGKGAPASHASKDQRNHGRWDTAAKRGSQDIHFDFSLL